MLDLKKKVSQQETDLQELDSYVKSNKVALNSQNQTDRKSVAHSLSHNVKHLGEQSQNQSFS